MRVCIIGAGPSGLSLLFHFKQRKNEGHSIPDIVCYEKQGSWGGLWNYDWRTGVDETGDVVHGSMYKYLWSNGPKEASLEYPDYTFIDHFKKNIPSFPPREVLLNYLQGRWKKHDLGSFIRYNHVVLRVFFKEGKFTLNVKNKKENREISPETFDVVINASGHYSTPIIPSFSGLESFEGRILHAHDFRSPLEFKGKRLLIIGASYSAEDISLQVLKYGASSVIISYRKVPLNFNWPSSISERPLLTHVRGSQIFFSDETKAEVDVIVFATGYAHHYPWMEESLRLKSNTNSLYPPNLYKGSLWLITNEETQNVNGRLFYVGAQNQIYTWTLIDVIAHWVVDCILGKISLPSLSEMYDDTRVWLSRSPDTMSFESQVDFQYDFIQDLIRDGNYRFTNLNVSHLLKDCHHNKKKNILTYRDKSVTSIFTGLTSTLHHTPWFEALDDSLESFVFSSNDSKSDCP